MVMGPGVKPYISVEVIFYTALIMLGFFLVGFRELGTKHIESVSVFERSSISLEGCTSLGWTCQSEGALPGKGLRISQPEPASSKRQGREAGAGNLWESFL